MTKEEAIKYLQQLYPNGGHCWLDEQRLEAICMAVKALQEETLSKDLEKEMDNYLPTVFSKDMDNGEPRFTTWFNALRKTAIYFANWQKTKDESTTEDLGEYINELSKQFAEVSFAKLSRIAVRVAKWQKEHLWKPADGDDLPDIDREVIALLDNGKVAFAHRPNPEGWDAKSIITEKVERYIPETYGKCGWNIPNVKWWLDCSLSNMED